MACNPCSKSSFRVSLGQTRLASDPKDFNEFLEILNMYKKGIKSTTDVVEEVCTLLGAPKCIPEKTGVVRDLTCLLLASDWASCSRTLVCPAAVYTFRPRCV